MQCHLSLFDNEVKKEQEAYDNIMTMDGKENAYVLHKELGEWMTDNVTVVRYNDKLLKTDEKIQELMERYKNININDTAKWSNQGASFTRQLDGYASAWHVLSQLVHTTVMKAVGLTYKPEFPERNDEEFLKTTMAKFNPAKNGPDFSYEEVDTSLIKPRKRDYSQKKQGADKS